MTEIVPEKSFSLQPTLQGPTLLLRPLRDDEFEQIYSVASDPLIWEQHPAPTRYQRPVFEKWFVDALASKGALVVVERNSGRLIGSSRFYDLNEEKKEVAIGYTFLSRPHWGGATNAEMKKLMLDHAFQWATAVWFHVGPNNFRSQKALQKIGVEFSHRAVVNLSGSSNDYCFYKVESAKYPMMKLR